MPTLPPKPTRSLRENIWTPIRLSRSLRIYTFFGRILCRFNRSKGFNTKDISFWKRVWNNWVMGKTYKLSTPSYASFGCQLRFGWTLISGFRFSIAKTLYMVRRQQTYCTLGSDQLYSLKMIEAPVDNSAITEGKNISKRGIYRPRSYRLISRPPDSPSK